MSDLSEVGDISDDGGMIVTRADAGCWEVRSIFILSAFDPERLRDLFGHDLTPVECMREDDWDALHELGL